MHVADVVERTVETMRAQLPDSTTIEVEISAEVGQASGDGDRLQQVLVNLLDNAVKYGGDRVEVRADRTNGNIRIFVVDAGPGISLADRERVFEKFYRADPQLSKAPSGTGLGLCISRSSPRGWAAALTSAREGRRSNVRRRAAEARRWEPTRERARS